MHELHQLRHRAPRARRQIATSAIAVALTAGLPATAFAQTAAPGTTAALPQRGYAAAAFGSPLAWGLGWGGVAGGAFAQSQNGSADETDASAGLAVGLGDARRYVSLDAHVVFSSLSGSSGSDASFGEVGSFGAKLSRNLDATTAFALGVNAAHSFGFTRDIEQPVYYANASRVFTLGSGATRRPLVGNLGIVAGGFEDTRFSRNKTVVRPFGSLAWYVHRQVSLIADYTGRYANAGVSVAPFRRVPATITLGAINLNDANGLGVQFGGSVSIAGRFL